MTTKKGIFIIYFWRLLASYLQWCYSKQIYISQMPTNRKLNKELHQNSSELQSSVAGTHSQAERGTKILGAVLASGSSSPLLWVRPVSAAPTLHQVPTRISDSVRLKGDT